MIVKYKESLAKHYLNPNPAPPTFKQTEAKYLNGHHTLYQLDGIYEKKCKNLLSLVIKTLAITFFSFGFALFSQKMRENWKSIRTGTKKVVVYLKTQAPSPTIEKVKAISSLNNAPPVKPEPPQPSLEDIKKQQLDALVKTLEGKSADEWISSLKKLEKDPNVPLKDFFLRLYKNEKYQQLINKTELQDLTKCKKITFSYEEDYDEDCDEDEKNDVEKENYAEGEKIEIECLQLDCDFLKLNSDIFNSQLADGVNHSLETDGNYWVNPDYLRVESFQILLKVIRDVSFSNILDIDDFIDLKTALDFFKFKDDIKKPIHEAIRKFLEKYSSENLQMTYYHELYYCVNKNHESPTLREKFVNLLITYLKDKSSEDQIEFFKGLKNFHPSIIVYLYDSWHNCPIDFYNLGKYFSLAFISQLYMASLKIGQAHIQRLSLRYIATLLHKKNHVEYNQSIDSLEPAILVNLFEQGELEIKYLTQAKLSLVREHYRIKYKDKSEEQINNDIVHNICKSFPRFLPTAINNKIFNELSGITKRIQLTFPEISFATIQSGKHYEFPFFSTILIIQKALEILNSEIDDEQKLKSYGDLIQSIPRFIFGEKASKAEHTFFLECLAKLINTEKLPLLLTSPYNQQSTVQFLFEILHSKDKDKIQILFRQYFAQSDLYGTAFSPFHYGTNIKHYETKEWGVIYLRPEFLEIIPLIDSSEKLEWILEILPQNSLKEILIECLRKGITVKENYIPKNYRISLSIKETEETFTRLGYKTL